MRGPAAQWLLLHQSEIHSVDEFFLAVEKEFVPADLQQRLRDDLHRLRQASCKGLMDYIAKFRHIISQVEDMTEIDQIIYFQRGLKTRTQEEVQYRRGNTLSEAITVALDFERAHSVGYNHHIATTPRPGPPNVARELNNEPELMEIDNARPFHRSSRVHSRRPN